MEKEKENKGKVKTKASKEAMRWADDDEDKGTIDREPEGMNTFDIRMSQEPDGLKAAYKIVDCIKRRGVCVCEANAPDQLLESAYYEAMELFEDGAFGPPLRVHDDRSMLESQLWGQALKDEDKVVWVRDAGATSGATTSASSSSKMNALKLLAKNMSDFAGGLGEPLQKEMNLNFDRIGHAMLSCYTGDRQYSLHLDNSHGEEGSDNEGLPDNGMRLTATYYINTHWEPDNGVEGGLDVFLSNPRETPSSASDAKKCPKLRVAPHADTLVLFLSEKMAHRVVRTQGKDLKWFALTVWTLNGAAMNQMSKKLLAMRSRAAKQDSDSDDD